MKFSFLGDLNLVQPPLILESYTILVFPSPGRLRSLSCHEWETLFCKQWNNSFFVSFHLVKEYSWASSMYQHSKFIPRPWGLRLLLTVLNDSFCLNLGPKKNLTNAWLPDHNSYPSLFPAKARLSWVFGDMSHLCIPLLYPFCTSIVTWAHRWPVNQDDSNPDIRFSY